MPTIQPADGPSVTPVNPATNRTCYCTTTTLALAILSIASVATFSYGLATSQLPIILSGATVGGMSSIALGMLLTSNSSSPQTPTDLKTNYQPTNLATNPPPTDLATNSQTIQTPSTTYTSKKLENGEMTKYTIKVENFSYKDFIKYLSVAPPAKKLLFSKILIPRTKHLDGHTFEITFYKGHAKADYQEELGEMPSVKKESGYYTYEEESTYVDFANEHIFGGGWRGRGTVQEEIMFATQSRLALLAYAADRCKLEQTLLPKNEEPFYVPDCQLDGTVGGLYGGGLLEQSQIDQNVKAFDPPQQRFGVVGIAAKCWGSGRYKPYSKEDLKHHFNLLYAAFKLHKAIYGDQVPVHTGRWGCGVFGGSVHTIFTLQHLAARAAGVPITLYDVSSNFEFGAIQKVVNDSQTVEEGITELEKLSTENPDFQACRPPPRG